MRRLVAIGLISTMSLSPCPALAAARGTAARPVKTPRKSPDADASISGTAKSSTGQPLANSAEQLRDLTAGKLVAKTTTSSTGEFTFTGIPPGTYEIEVLNAAGQIVGTSASFSVTAGATITGIVVAVAPTAAVGAAGAGAAAGAAAAGAVGGGINTALLVTAVAAGAGIAGVIAVKSATSSNSR